MTIQRTSVMHRMRADDNRLVSALRMPGDVRSKEDRTLISARLVVLHKTIGERAMRAHGDTVGTRSALSKTLSEMETLTAYIPFPSLIDSYLVSRALIRVKELL